MDYSIDTAAARASEGGRRLTEPGKYLGTLTRVEAVKSSKGTHGVSFSFRSDTGESTDFLDLWTVNNNGDQLAGYNTLQAIMTCAKVKNIKVASLTVDKYNADAGKPIPTKIDGYPELTNVKIGFLFQKEISDGKSVDKPYENLRIVGVFNAETELTASEILDRKTSPEALPKAVQWLSGNLVKDKRSGSHSANRAAQTAQSPADDFSETDNW